MEKFYGKIGFTNTTEVRPGIWTEGSPIERYYYGNIIKNDRRWEKAENINDDFNINCQISIISDSFAINNIYKMKYVELFNSLWKITSANVSYPRVILTLGGVYNGH